MNYKLVSKACLISVLALMLTGFSTSSARAGDLSISIGFGVPIGHVHGYGHHGISIGYYGYFPDYHHGYKHRHYRHHPYHHGYSFRYYHHKKYHGHYRDYGRRAYHRNWHDDHKYRGHRYYRH